MRYVIAVLSLFLLGFGGVRVTSLQPSNAVVSTSSTPTLGTAWRDQEVTTLFTHGEIKLRLTGSGNGLFFNVGVASPGAVRAGIISGGTEFLTYVQDTPSSCITNWPTTGAHTFTFGVQGFTVYLKIDGVQAIDTCQITTLNPTGAINYYEYRLPAMGNGQPSVAVTTGSASATFTYFSYTALRSNYASGQFDPRDFGMRAIGAVTGSMSAASPTLNLNSAVDIRVGDTVIVEIGGESGAEPGILLASGEQLQSSITPMRPRAMLIIPSLTAPMHISRRMAAFISTALARRHGRLPISEALTTLA